MIIDRPPDPSFVTDGGVHDWSALLARAQAIAGTSGPRHGLAVLVSGLRPETRGDHAAGVRSLTRWLGTPEAGGAGNRIGALVRGLLADVRVYPALTASGLSGGEGFVAELLARIGRRVLPPVPADDDLRAAIHDVFPGRHDHEWVGRVPDQDWLRLLDAIGMRGGDPYAGHPELVRALRVLGHHAGSLGMQSEITERLPHLERESSPFLALPAAIEVWASSPDTERATAAEAIRRAVSECRQEVERLRAENREHGTSLWLTGLKFRLLRLLERIENLLEPAESGRFDRGIVRLFKQVVEAEKTYHHVLPHVRASADLVALEIVEHAAHKGSKYITSGRRDYFWFLVSSMGGGLLVALFSFAKVILGQWDVSLAVEALLFGINYALCFVAIYLTGATLATKQPAMTANTLARSLGNEGDDLPALQNLVVRVWRSQFISFVGNLVVALPVAILLSELFYRLAGGFVTSPEKAATMLVALHPWWSGALAYAAVAGVLLFLAGVFSGWVDNWNRHRRISERLAHQRHLLRGRGRDAARRLAGAVDDHLGAIAGNVFLGFGLGSMGTIGEILGAPLDIRHIAFASAELGTALEVLRFDVPFDVLAPVAIGVALIGLVNFLVSFGLSLTLALESRGLRSRSTARLAAGLVARFRERPADWFYPPTADRDEATR